MIRQVNYRGRGGSLATSSANSKKKTKKPKVRFTLSTCIVSERVTGCVCIGAKLCGLEAFHCACRHLLTKCFTFPHINTGGPRTRWIKVQVREHCILRNHIQVSNRCCHSLFLCHSTADKCWGVCWEEK